MALVWQGPKSRAHVLSEMLGPALGQGLANFTGSYLANRALDQLLSDKQYKDKPVEDRLEALQTRLSPYGQFGENVFNRRLQIEQAKEQAGQRKLGEKKAEVLRKRLNKEPLTEAEKKIPFTPQEELAIAQHEQKGQIAQAKAAQPKGGVTAHPMPKEVSDVLFPILNANRDATSEELRERLDEAGVPPVWADRYVESRAEQEKIRAKEQTSLQEQARKETLPARQEYSEKAALARQGIENKERGLELVKRGNINDPTYVALAEALPLNLGKRLLSDDTVEYKAGLVDEFGDLRKIFQGQTRVKEIELLEDKIPDLYLTDSQKEAILKSRMNVLKADLIREETAEEVEKEMPNLGVLQFRKEVEKRAKPKLEALFNRILDEQNAIIQDAENKKKIPLDPNDPEDYKIMVQIKKEAGGDKEKAKALAKQRGYTVKGSK